MSESGNGTAPPSPPAKKNRGKLADVHCPRCEHVFRLDLETVKLKGVSIGTCVVSIHCPKCKLREELT